MASANTLTADMLADLETPRDLKLSPSGSQVVYSLSSFWTRPRGRWVTSLWVADVGTELSARQLTPGDCHQSSPQWSPDGRSIAFISDCAKEGVGALWSLSFDDEARPSSLTPTECEQGVSKFAWSRDGKYIAYLSADEKSAERKAKEDKKDDAKVYGEHWDYARLRVVEVASKKITTLVSKDCHIYDLVWSSDSKSIVYITQEAPEYEIHVKLGTNIEIVQLDNHASSLLVNVPGLIYDICWVKDELWWRARYSIDKFKSSLTVYNMPIGTKEYKRYGYGENDCASPWALPPGLIPLPNDKLAVQVQSGLSDQLHIIPDGTKVLDMEQEVRSWDITITNDQTIVVFTTSTADKPLEVYSIVDEKTICLSEHGKEIAELKIASSECFYTKAQDGTDLDAVFVTPQDSNRSKPWPTIVLVHGGPYGRVSQGFDLPNSHWSSWLASKGFAILLPNYRGGSSHGEAFAAGVRGTAGVLDYSDTIDIVKAAISANLVDSERVAIGGWSYGGYLSYLAVARDSTFHFQAAMCGAGLSDWDHTIMTSSGWRSAIEIAGTGPWIGGVHNTHNREGSALWQMKDAKTPVLILQGEKDDIVPVAQALGFHHGCMHYGIPCELVLYPREGHGAFPPFERLHYVDALERMLRFYRKYLGMEEVQQ